MDLGPEDIHAILRIFNESQLEELRLDLGGTQLYVSKRVGGPAAIATAPVAPPQPPAARSVPAADAVRAPAPVDGSAAEPAPALAAPADGLLDIRSPLLGVFYRRPAPDKPPFVDLGGDVGPDDPVCIIDVMKMFTQVPAGVSGRVVEILATDGQLVEHGQLLMRIDPA